MASHVDDVVDPAHDGQIPVFVLEPCVTRQVIPVVSREIGVDVTGVVVPQGGECSRWKRQLDHDAADFTVR